VDADADADAGRLERRVRTHVPDVESEQKCQSSREASERAAGGDGRGSDGGTNTYHRESSPTGMRAVVCSDFDESRVEEVERPAPAPEEVLLKVRRVQLSVTECNLYRGNEIAHYEQVAARLADGPARLFGHEFCAEVVERGAAVEGFDVGDRVYASGKIPCGECPPCERGFEHQCQDLGYVGYERPGALAEYFTVPTSPLSKLPDGVTDAEGAAMQPLATTLVGVDDAGVSTGDVVAVVGAGVVGHQAGQLALERGASEVYAVDIDAEKLSLAAENGLTPVDARETDPVAVVRDRTDGVGADLTFEAVGGEQDDVTDGDDPVAQAFRMTRRGGAVSQMGHIIGEVTLRPRDVRSRGVDWLTPPANARSLTPNVHSGELAARLVAQGRVSIAEYTTHVLDGLEAFERMVEVTLNKPEHGALGPAQLDLTSG
jgi:threonine dehydrogenase-like Zn-dependent dehydrogenase